MNLKIVNYEFLLSVMRSEDIEKNSFNLMSFEEDAMSNAFRNYNKLTVSVGVTLYARKYLPTAWL